MIHAHDYNLWSLVIFKAYLTKSLCFILNRYLSWGVRYLETARDSKYEAPDKIGFF